MAIPIVALDTANAEAAFRLVDRLPDAEFYKVGLQLYTAEGPSVVERLKNRGMRVFLDLKLHDIPNTVASAVRSAAGHGVDLLTVHAVGGTGMLSAAAEAAADKGPALLAVTVLTSLDEQGLGEAWGRGEITLDDEVVRLAGLAKAAGVHGLVASVHETARLKREVPGLSILTPGIRLPGDAAHDQSRVATPGRAAGAGADYLVLGRTVTAAADPAAAYARVLDELDTAPVAG